MSSRMPESPVHEKWGAGLGVLARLLAAVAPVLALAVPVLATAPAHAAEAGPTVTVPAPRTAVDATTEVVGAGFEPGATLDVEVCGVPDAAGKLTCSPTVRQVETSLSGRFAEKVKVVEPAGDCPCVLKVSGPGQAPVLTSLDIAAHPVAKAVQSPQLVVDSARVEGAGGLGAWFTGSADAELVLDLRNAGVAPAQPTLQLEVAEAGSLEEGAAVADPGVEAVAPGERSTVRVPVTVGGFPGGASEVFGDVVVGDFHQPVSATVTVRPWGLYLLALAAVVGVVLVVRRRRAPARPAGTRSHRAAPRVDSAAPAVSSRRAVPSSSPSRASSGASASAPRGAEAGSSRRSSSRPVLPPPVPWAGLAPAESTDDPPTAGPTASDPLFPVVDPFAAPPAPVEQEPARPRTGLHLADVARAAADAARAAADAARAAEAREAAEQSAAIRDEVAAVETDARLDALARTEFSGPVQEERPEPPVPPRQARPRSESAEPGQSREKGQKSQANQKSRRGRRGKGSREGQALVGPPRLSETPIDRSHLGPQEPETRSTFAPWPDDLADPAPGAAVAPVAPGTSFDPWPDGPAQSSRGAAPETTGAQRGSTFAPWPDDLGDSSRDTGSSVAQPGLGSDPWAGAPSASAWDAPAAGAAAPAAPLWDAPAEPPAVSIWDTPAEPPAAVTAPEPADEPDAVTAYLQATAPELLAPRPERPRFDPLTDPLPGPLPVAPPPPLDLPAVPGPHRQSVVPQPVAPAVPAQPQGTDAGVLGTTAVPQDDPGAGSDGAPLSYEEAKARAATTMAEALRVRAQARNEALVGEALEAIRTHTSEAPALLPDPHEYVPTQRDRRSTKGGKRAAR